MKKVRFMLLAIAVIAIAGGTLAFKAKFNSDICTAAATTFTAGPRIGEYTCIDAAQNFTATCSVKVEDKELIDVDADELQLCYTLTTAPAGNCPTNVTGANCGLATTENEGAE